MRRQIALIFGIVLVITACGSSPAEDGPTDAGGQETTPPPDEETPPVDVPAAAGDGRVVVVIGDTTYGMGLVEGGSGICASMADGSLVVNAGTSDLDLSDLNSPKGAGIYAVIQSDDWRPGSPNEPYVSVTDYDSGETWTAGGSRVFGLEAYSVIVESDLNDAQARLTVKFIEEGQAIGSQQEPLSYDGAVDVDCDD